MITGKGYTNRGGREYNEDAGIFGIKGSSCYAVIADGLGGHGGGDRASKAAVEAIRECAGEMPKGRKVTEDDAAEWFERANQKVLQLQTDTSRMKTTLAFLYVDEEAGKAVLAHLGDSRIYHFKDGKCDFYTFDHSVSRMAVLAGEIEMSEIRFHADRNRLLKAIGKSEDVKAETREISLTGGMFHAFLLCTDGFWEYVTEEEMEDALANAATAEEWIALMRGRLKDRVRKMEKAENDNHSAIAIWVTEERK